MNDDTRAILITGCSSGIGHETARHLAVKGHRVYATARRPEAIADLAEAGCETLACDVTDEASMKACVEAVEEAEGAIYALVNNAGYSQSGAVETVPMESVRRQFETNVFGLLRMCQLALPGMRKPGPGPDRQRQLDGRQADLPGGGIYHATKHAVEALSDAMRFEVRGFGDRCGGDRARPDQDRLRRRRGRLDGRERGRALRRVQSTRSARRPPAPTRAGSRSSAAARTRSPARSRRRSPQGARRPATR